MSFIFTLVLLAIAGYVLYSAFSGKGKLYSLDNIIQEKIPQFLKLLRPLYFALGVILLLMACTSAFQNFVYSEVAYKFGPDFSVYFSERIDKKGNIKDTSANIEGLYGYNEMSSVFATLDQPQIPEGESPVFAEAAKDANGNYIYLGFGESTPGENPTYTNLRNAIPYKTTQILTWVFMGVALLLVVGLFVLMNRFTDKEKAAKAKEKAKTAGSSLPSSAFEFDEETDDNTNA